MKMAHISTLKKAINLKNSNTDCLGHIQIALFIQVIAKLKNLQENLDLLFLSILMVCTRVKCQKKIQEFC